MARSKRRLVSAGLLMCRLDSEGRPEVLLAHPGGPYFARKDEGAWTVPKGLVEEGETDLLAVAKREFAEEIGVCPPTGAYHSLGEVTQKSGKVVHGWAFAGDLNPATVKSNTFELEWPPRSGRRQTFPEVDRAAFFGLAEAKTKIIAAQTPLVERACSPACVTALFGADARPE
jgi:predicted NUDIX family NTP pyrophosphohydrolase